MRRTGLRKQIRPRLPVRISNVVDTQGRRASSWEPPSIGSPAQTLHRKNESLRPRLIAGVQGRLDRGLAQPSDTPHYDWLGPY
jgi:hypothetical protein